MQYLVNKSDLKTIVEEYSLKQIEAGLVAAYLGKMEKRNTKNEFLQKIMEPINEEEIRKINSYLVGRKINPTMEALASFFEMLVPVDERVRSGMFVTPELIANHLATQTVHPGAKTVCDPTCGSGVLLVAAARQIRRTRNISAKKIIEKMIFGVDLYAKNVLYTKILLSLFILESGEDHERISFNIAAADSLMLDWESGFEKVFAGNGGFDIVLCNPPYAMADLHRLSSSATRFTCMAKTRLPAFIPFLELFFHISSARPRSGYVMPLSISYGKTDSFRKIRGMISQSSGSWHFSFYDRSPDSLFGDNVKVRNCILVHKGNSNFPPRIYVTGLTRWSSKTRNDLFANQKYQLLNQTGIVLSIPKISERIESAALSVLSDAKNRIDQKISFKKTDKNQAAPNSDGIAGRTIYYYPTAYNWLSVFRARPAHDNSVSLNSLRSITCESARDADFLYACLNSKLAYWWWMVFGDGFHLDHATLSSMPFNPDIFKKETRRFILSHGKILHQESTNYSTFSINAGTRTVSFNMLHCRPTIHEIDKKIIDGLNMNPDFADLAKGYTRI